MIPMCAMARATSQRRSQRRSAGVASSRRRRDPPLRVEPQPRSEGCTNTASVTADTPVRDPPIIHVQRNMVNARYSLEFPGQRSKSAARRHAPSAVRMLQFSSYVVMVVWRVVTAGRHFGLSRAAAEHATTVYPESSISLTAGQGMIRSSLRRSASGRWNCRS